MIQKFKKIHRSGFINSLKKQKTKDTIQGMTTSDQTVAQNFKQQFGL